MVYGSSEFMNAFVECIQNDSLFLALYNVFSGITKPQPYQSHCFKNNEMLRGRGKENGDERFNIHYIIALIMIKDMLAK